MELSNFQWTHAADGGRIEKRRSGVHVAVARILITEHETFCARSSTAPEDGAAPPGNSVHGVDLSHGVFSTVLPLERAEEEMAMFMASAPRRFPAISNELCVRGGSFKEQVDLGLSLQDRSALPGTVALVHIGLRQVEKRCDLKGEISLTARRCWPLRSLGRSDGDVIKVAV